MFFDLHRDSLSTNLVHLLLRFCTGGAMLLVLTDARSWAVADRLHR
jgi:hypothetical protein